MSIKMYGMVATLSMFPKKFCQKFVWCLAVPICVILSVFGGPSNDLVKAIQRVGEPNPAEAGKGSAIIVEWTVVLLGYSLEVSNG